MRAEAKILSAEELARTRLGDPNAVPTSQQLTDAYIQVAMNDKGNVYGLGSAQHAEEEPNESAAASLRRHLDTDMRLTGVEGDVSHITRAVNVLLQANGINPVTLVPISRNEDGSSAPSPESHSAHDPTQLP